MTYFIIVTYNSSKYIEKCINSILLHEPDCKIIVVDNNSKDDTLLLLAKFTNIKLIQNSINFGFGKANNVAINLAISEGADYVYLLNHDAYLVESVVDLLKDKFKYNPEFGILTPLQVKESRKELEINFARYLTLDGIILRIFNDTILEDNKKEIYEVSFAQAASWLIKKEVIEKVGVFNPLFFHYGEDNEYLNRLKFHQFKIGVVTDSKIVHLANPLNLSHKKNFDRYHRNREFNRWLVKQLDINIEFTFGSWLQSLSPYIKMSIKYLFQLKFLKFLRLFKLLIRIIKISSYIRTLRIINS